MGGAKVLAIAAAIVLHGCIGVAAGDPVASAARPDCPITRPDPAFVAPEPQPAHPPARYAAEWYGTAALWTMLDRNGETWTALPRSGRGLGQKTFWWSAAWRPMEEPAPAIAVTGTRLDRPGTLEAGPPGTNARADFGSAMLIGVEFPEPGCWRLTAAYRGAELSYVVRVDE